MFTKSSRGSSKDHFSVRFAAALLAFGVMMAGALLAMPAVASIADVAVADSDAKCLKCHSKNLKRKMEDGEKMSLHVASADFSDSAHGGIGCTACHQEIAARKHPKEKVAINNRESILKVRIISR